MHRVFGLLVLAAVVLGPYILLMGPQAPVGAREGVQGAPVAYGGWAVGLCMGLVLAWVAGLDWRNLPDRLTQWVTLQRRRLGWMLIGGVCAGILLLL
jgi:hypothetical protein